MINHLFYVFSAIAALLSFERRYPAPLIGLVLYSPLINILREVTATLLYKFLLTSSYSSRKLNCLTEFFMPVFIDLGIPSNNFYKFSFEWFIVNLPSFAKVT